MRKRFEQQMTIGQTPISEIDIDPKSKNPLDQLIAALKAIYCDEEYRDKIFDIIEKHLPAVDKGNGRPGMNLWTTVVLAQVRLCLGTSYNMLHHLANNDLLLRQLIGINDVFGVKYIKFEYQNIYDNVTRLNDIMLTEINDIIVEFGHGKVFKKKETTPVQAKTDSFVVETNVHFPTDYNLLWDCSRKCLDIVSSFLKQYPQMAGWRKIANWRSELKSLMRKVGRISGGGGKNKMEKLQNAAEQYLAKSRLLVQKLCQEKKNLPCNNESDLAKQYALEHYIELMEKHIDLVERRIIKGESIPCAEKLMSIFEPYTEWVVKGKSRPEVELGKKVSITTDQYGLILIFIIMCNEQDRDIIIKIADMLLNRYKLIYSWSFDKGHWNAFCRALLELVIPRVILPKLGKLTAEEKEKENDRVFKRLKNNHSAVESNINELEHRGLNRCPDRQYRHFKTYIALGVCAYNLKKIGKKILEDQLKALPNKKTA